MSSLDDVDRFITADGQLVFMVAALGIVLNPSSNTQTFFGGKMVGTGGNVPPQHDDDILCLGISTDRKLAVTGQVGAQPKVFVWDIATKTVKAQYKLGKNTRGIVVCRFSYDGKYVAFVDNSNDHNLYIMSVADSSIKSVRKTGPDPVTDLEWSQKAGDYKLCVVGMKLVKYFILLMGQDFRRRVKRGRQTWTG